jgi:hypothetical protein
VLREIEPLDLRFLVHPERAEDELQGAQDDKVAAGANTAVKPMPRS